MKHKIPILYEDDAIVVVNKPPNFLTIPDRYAVKLPNLYTYLTQKYGRIFTVHRLDKETSGLLVFARNEASHKYLSEQFSSRSVEKFYYALVEGQLHQSEGSIDKPIGPHPNGKGKMIVSAKGKVSMTHYKVVEQFRRFTLVQAQITTGRTHQIRVHFKAIGYPLAVDALYGKRSAFYLSEIKQKNYRINKDEEERPLLSRTALHAWSLRLKHPETEAVVHFVAPLPKDLAAVVKQLRKWNN